MFFKILYGKIMTGFAFYNHKKSWRKMNRHNQTIAINIFPISKVSVGNFTYGDLKIISFGNENEGLKIGHFVSIASGVKFILGGNHFTNRISMFPFNEKHFGNNILDTYSKGEIIIGDDVWIGMDSLILSGVKIGSGAVIAAGSVVTKDVNPYTVIGGNPAKEIKVRFNSELIELLEKINYSCITLSQQDTLHYLIQENIEPSKIKSFFKDNV